MFIVHVIGKLTHTQKELIEAWRETYEEKVIPEPVPYEEGWCISCNCNGKKT